MNDKSIKSTSIKLFLKLMKELKEKKIPIKNRLNYKKIAELVGMSIKSIKKWENRTN